MPAAKKPYTCEHTCAWCGASAPCISGNYHWSRVKKGSQRFCSRECKGKFESRARGRVVIDDTLGPKTCPRCGVLFYMPKTTAMRRRWLKKKYCSLLCARRQYQGDSGGFETRIINQLLTALGITQLGDLATRLQIHRATVSRMINGQYTLRQTYLVRRIEQVLYEAGYGIDWTDGDIHPLTPAERDRHDGYQAALDLHNYWGSKERQLYEIELSWRPRQPRLTTANVPAKLVLSAVG